MVVPLGAPEVPDMVHHCLELVVHVLLLLSCWDHASSPKVLQKETPSTNPLVRNTEAIAHEASTLERIQRRRNKPT
jgi:hypothetical protein